MSSAATTPVIVAGVRTPFLETAGAYRNMMAHELGAAAMAGLLQRALWDPAHLDIVAMGIVVHEINTTNVAREAMLGAGVPSTVPAFTTSMAGLSPNMAVTNVCDMIRAGRISAAVAGGMETFSDMPIRLSARMRRLLMQLRQARSTKARLKALAGLRPADFTLDIPKSADFTTGQTMGASVEAMARRYPVTREEVDRFALQSHQRALRSIADGWHAADIVAVSTPDGASVSADNSPRADMTAAGLARLKPVFDQDRGIVTAASASRFTDGAAALLMTSQARAESAGVAPLAIVRDSHFAGVADMHHEMLLGPAMAIPPLLQRHGLRMDDVAVFEWHEAFAAQILVNQRCLASDEFARQRLGLDHAPGAVPEDRLNIHGGSLALGNPFAATGARLLLNAARRLQESGERYAVVSSCAGGGLGTAILLEHPGRA